MSFPDITNTDSVRAILGVSERELRDEVLTDPVFSTQLTEHLYDIDEDILDNYKAAFEAAPRTATQERFVNVLQTYAAYKVASYLLGEIDMVAPEVIQEAKSMVQRSSDAEKDLAEAITASLNSLYSKLTTLYAKLKAGYTVPVSAAALPSVLIAGLGTDPVTG